MTASLVETLRFNGTSQITTTQTIDFAATVLAGDVVVVVPYMYNTNSLTSTYTCTAGTGWGATTLRSYFAGSNGTAEPSAAVYSATATADGALTLTASTPWFGGWVAFLCRGVTEAVAAASVLITTGTSITGPSQLAAGGQLVLGVGLISSSSAGGFSMFAGYTPSTGWATSSANGTVYVRANTTSRVPSGSATAHQLTDTGTAARVYRIVQVVLGTDGTAVTGVIGAAAAAPVAAAAAQLLDPGVIGAVAPAPFASVVAAPSFPAVIGAAAAAPVAAAAAQLLAAGPLDAGPPAPFASVSTELTFPAVIGAVAPAPFASVVVAREKSTPRHLLAAELTAYLPDDFVVMPYARDGVSPMRPTVMLAVDNLERFAAAPMAVRSTVWRLIVLADRDDPDQADDRVDNAVQHVLDAIDANPILPPWRSCERGVYGSATELPCYEIRLPVHYQKESTP